MASVAKRHFVPISDRIVNADSRLTPGDGDELIDHVGKFGLVCRHPILASRKTPRSRLFTINALDRRFHVPIVPDGAGAVKR